MSVTTNNEKPIRLAVIGAGHLGRFHSKLAAASDRFDLVAICDPSEPQREKVACEVRDQQPGVQTVADYHDVFDQIDAAVLATPTVSHHAIGSELLGRGLHCLIEKPLAATAAEATALVDAADRQGVVLQVGHVERYNPALELARPAIRDPKFITANRTSGYTFRSTDIGCVLDIMIHDIDLVLGLTESPVTGVSAMGFSVLGDNEDMATAQLTFASGCVAQLTASRVSYRLERKMQVFTDSGFTSIDFNSREVTRVAPRPDVLARDFSVAELSAEQRDRYRAGLFDELLVKTTSDAPPVNAIELEQTDFAAAVTGGEVPRVTGSVGRDAVVVAERVLDAIHRHAWDGSLVGRAGAMAMPLADAQQVRKAG